MFPWFPNPDANVQNVQSGSETAFRGILGSQPQTNGYGGVHGCSLKVHAA